MTDVSQIKNPAHEKEDDTLDMIQHPDGSREKRGPRSLTCRISACVLVLMCVAMTTAPSLAAERNVLATFAGNAITDAEVITKAARRFLLRPQAFSDTALIRELVDDVIIDSVISRVAPKIDLSREYGFWAEVRRGVITAAAQLYQNDVFSPLLKFDSTQIRKFYESHLARYMVPHEQRYVRNITIYYPMEKIPKIYNRTPDPLYEGWNPQTVIEALYARLEDGEDFAELAKVHSEEPRTKAAGGDIGWVSKESLPDDEFGQMILKIPLHQISKPFTSRIGWHIVQVTGIRAPGPAPIDGMITQDITTLLRDSVGRELAARVVDSLASAGTLTVLEETLQQPDSTWKPNTPLAIANGVDTILAAEYLEYVNRLKVRRIPLPVTLEQKREPIRAIYSRLCMLNALRRLGYLTRPEVIARRNEMIRERAESMLMAEMSDLSYVPDSTAVLRYFREHATEYARPQSYMVRFLKFADQGQAASVAAAWKSGNAPDSMETRWVGKSDVPAGVWNALSQMQEGGVTDAIAGDGEYWVTTLAQKSDPVTVADAAPGIRARLQSIHNWKRRQEWIRRNGGPYGITRDPDRYASVILPPQSEVKLPPPPGTGADTLSTF